VKRDPWAQNAGEQEKPHAFTIPNQPDNRDNELQVQLDQMSQKQETTKGENEKLIGIK
jgi:hypothetical protein